MPVPDLARPPVPPITPLWVRVVPALVLNVPPPSSVVARPVAMSAVVCSVLPTSVSPPGALPRLASRAIDSVPALTVVPPA